jgi:hypothetical protein
MPQSAPDGLIGGESWTVINVQGEEYSVRDMGLFVVHE